MAEVPAESATQETVVTSARSTRPTTDTNVIMQMVVGIAGTVAVAFAVGFLQESRVPQFAYVNDLINERGPVQYVELFMAFMVAAMVVMKLRVVRAQIGTIAEGPIPSDLDLTDDEHIHELRQSIERRDDYSWSIVLNRMDRLLALWLGSKDVSRVAAWSGAEAERDAAGSDSSYAISRVLVWAIPILGFIGTVMGLGTAVQGFSEFLGGAAELSAIKDAIGNVTAGLGVAFDTTLLALILSVFLMFPLSSVQHKEESLFLEIDNYLDDMLISRFPSPEQQPLVIENLEDAIEAAFRRYIPDPDRYDEVFTRSIDKAANSVEEKFGVLANNYEATLKDLTDRLTAGLSTVGDAVEISLRKVVADLHEQESVLKVSRDELAKEERQKLGALLTDLQTSAVSVAGEYKKSAETMQETIRQSADTSLQAAENLSGRMKTIVEMAANIEDLLKIEQAIEKGLKGITSAEDFQKTLQDLRSHLATTDEFCSRLSKPRVITLREEVDRSA